MIWSTEEIVRSYRMAADPKKQIKVLAELNACSVKEIRQVLGGRGRAAARDGDTGGAEESGEKALR